jgi:hypothetical protein
VHCDHGARRGQDDRLVRERITDARYAVARLSGIEFADTGVRTLKGVPAEWQLLAVSSA